MIRNKKLMTVKVDLTNVCNLRCPYCYIHKDKPSYLTLEQVNTALNCIRQLPHIYDKHCLFFGGEPSLAHNLINEICKENNDFTFSIISNGYMVFYQNDQLFYKKFLNTTISIEGTEKAYRELRTEHSLHDRLKMIANMKKMGINVMVNMSVNGILLDDFEEFLSNVKYLRDNGVYVGMFSIRGDNKFKNTDDYVRFLNLLKEKDTQTYREVLEIENYEVVDGDTLCSFDNTITITSNGRVSQCSASNETLGSIHDLDSYVKIFTAIPKHHKSLWKGCSNCVVPVGMCQVSCPEYIRECYKNDKIDELEHVCEFEIIKEFYRRKDTENGD